MLIKHIHIWLLFSLGQLIYSQGADTNLIQYTPKVNIAALVFVNPYLSTGNAQYFNEWTKGDIEFEDGRIAHNVFIRYNSALDELMWLRESDYQVGIVYKYIVKSFSFFSDDKSLNMRFIKLDGRKVFLVESEDIFLQMLVSGDISLYCHRKKTFIKTPGIFKDNNSYFIEKKSEFSGISLSRSSLFSIFLKEDKKQLKKLIKENKLKINKESDFIKTIDLFNQLKNNSN